MAKNVLSLLNTSSIFLSTHSFHIPVPNIDLGSQNTMVSVFFEL